MSNAPVVGNLTQLVFCNPVVFPQEVTRILDMRPSFAERIEPQLSSTTSPLGTWKLQLTTLNTKDSVEAQVDAWISLLEPKASAFDQLKEKGYRPYLDCRADKDSLSICIEPEALIKLGRLNIALSLWVYEQE
jgi:Domain of unknown function (DUF4279)